jgi:threonine synthase
MRPFWAGTFSDDEFRADRQGLQGLSPCRPRADGAAGPNHFLLELFHGPTLAFKDFAMQLIGQMMQAALAKTGERITIVGATSAIPGRRRWRRSGGFPTWMCSSCSRMAGCRMCSAAR